MLLSARTLVDLIIINSLSRDVSKMFDGCSRVTYKSALTSLWGRREKEGVESARGAIARRSARGPPLWLEPVGAL